MKTILILGAGLSSSSLIRYLLSHAAQEGWLLRIVDQDVALVKQKIGGSTHAVAVKLDALSAEERRPEIAVADLVISMLPARHHAEVARDCIHFRKNLITPSYISAEMASLNEQAREAGILIMNEIGVDPGIDHMSAMRIINEIKAKGGRVQSFKSYCGGLIAPESDDNPWNYKFTWNPRNVVLAGQGVAACFIRNGEYKYIPYHRLFKRMDALTIPGYGDFVGYANRDSLSYRKVYGLDAIPTIFRATLRRPNFCNAWDVFIELGMTDDNYIMEGSERLTRRNFLNAFLPYAPSKSVEEKFKEFLGPTKVHLYDKFVWLDLFNDTEVLGISNGTPAMLLQAILVEKLTLNEGDKDMLVMLHEFTYEKAGETHKIVSYMVNIGEDQVYTSMSNTVGLPIGICAKMILNGELTLTGVQLPVQKEVYDPILTELESYKITFVEEESVVV